MWKQLYITVVRTSCFYHWLFHALIGNAQFLRLYIIFTGFPAGAVKIREHQQLQQKISKLSVLVASQMDITSYHFDRFKVPWETSSKPRQGKARGRFLRNLASWRMREGTKIPYFTFFSLGRVFHRFFWLNFIHFQVLGLAAFGRRPQNLKTYKIQSKKAVKNAGIP